MDKIKRKIPKNGFEPTNEDIFNPEYAREKLKNVYDDSFFCELADKLNLSCEQRKKIEKIILFAGLTYVDGMDINEEIEPVYKAKAQISNIQNTLLKAKQQYQDFIKGPEGTIKEFFECLDRQYEDVRFRKIFQALDSYSKDTHPEDDGLYHPLEAVSDFFELLIVSLEKTETEYNKPSALKKYNVLKWWLQDMEFMINKYTNVSFTQGKYYTGVGYISECLDLLHHIIMPLDPKITRQKLANKIKEYNDLKSKK